MTIEVPAAEVYALAGALRSQSATAQEVVARLVATGDVGGLTPAVEGFLECHRAAAGALAAELDWLAGAVTGVADSWLGLDGSLLAPHGAVARR